MGLEQGKAIGLQQGKLAGKIETANNLLAMGIDIKSIAKATNLSVQEIQALKVKIEKK